MKISAFGHCWVLRWPRVLAVLAVAAVPAGLSAWQWQRGEDKLATLARIAQWEREGAVSRRAKRLATAMMSICAVLLFATAPRAWMAGIGTLVMAVVAAWLWRRPEPRH